MKRILYMLVLICIGTNNVSSQVTLSNILNRDKYLARVKLMDEFFMRFNGEELRHNVTEEYADRESGILFLFDLSKFESKQDSGFTAAREFAQRTVESKVLLNYEDRDWYAKIKCHGKIGKKAVTFYMFLCVEERDSTYRWTINNVGGEIFINSRDFLHKDLFIMPDDHEQFFQSVRKTVTETHEFIDDYAPKDYKADALSTFLALVRFGYLKIEAVTDVEFIFLQVPEYIFSVKQFERETENAGWLIDSVVKVSNECKQKTLKELHR